MTSFFRCVDPAGSNLFSIEMENRSRGIEIIESNGRKLSNRRNVQTAASPAGHQGEVITLGLEVRSVTVRQCFAFTSPTCNASTVAAKQVREASTAS